MTYLDFEKEYAKYRPTEPCHENEDASDWANLTRYAEDNLQHLILDIVNAIIFLQI